MNNGPSSIVGTNMTPKSSLLDLSTELQLEIIGLLPWWDLYALRLTSQHFNDLVGPIEASFEAHCGRGLAWTDESIRAMEESIRAKGIDVLFCGACCDVLSKAWFEDEDHGTAARKDMDQDLKRKFWHPTSQHYRC